MQVCNVANNSRRNVGGAMCGDLKQERDRTIDIETIPRGCVAMRVIMDTRCLMLLLDAKVRKNVFSQCVDVQRREEEENEKCRKRERLMWLGQRAKI